MKGEKTRRIVAVLLIILALISFSGCGNKELFDTTYTYKYAIIAFPDGECKKIEIKKWTDYEGEQLQITSKDGVTYLVSSFNCVLVSE